MVGRRPPFVPRERLRPTACAAFALSDSLRPYAVVHAVHPIRGHATTWHSVVASETEAACEAFCAAMGLAGVAYRVGGGGLCPDLARELQSRWEALGREGFALELRVGTAMFVDRCRVLSALRPGEAEAAVRAAEAGADWAGLLRAAPSIRPFIVRGRAGAAPALHHNFRATVLAVNGRGAPHRTTFEFHPSDKFEPVVVGIALGPDGRRALRLDAGQIAGLESALTALQRLLKLPEPMQYTYTSATVRADHDEAVRQGRATVATKAHSRDFHIKVHVPLQTYVCTFPALRLFDLAGLREAAEPVAANFSRRTVPWAEVRAALEADAA